MAVTLNWSFEDGAYVISEAHRHLTLHAGRTVIGYRGSLDEFHGGGWVFDGMCPCRPDCGRLLLRDGLVRIRHVHPDSVSAVCQEDYEVTADSYVIVLTVRERLGLSEGDDVAAKAVA